MAHKLAELPGLLIDSVADSAFLPSPLPRLRWLVRLRWLALAAVAVGLAVAAATGLPWVSLPPVAATLAVGVLYNLWFTLRLYRLEPGALPDGRRELQLHAVADVLALSLLLLSAGGLRNPVCMFYGFHVVLGATLGYAPGALVSAGSSLLGVALLGLAERAGLLLSPPLLSPPLWLVAGAAALMVLWLAYFSLGALRFLQREQSRALENYGMLLGGLDTLKVGLELVGQDNRLLLANRRAVALHPCEGDRWRPPAGPRRFAHAEDGETRIYELLEVPAQAQPGPGGLRAYLYVDRTDSTLDEQRAMMLERLASLGRAMQGVAHELNTPLSSIQTLAVDLSHSAHSADAEESISLIIDEARRCREITRELLANTHDGRPGQRVHVLLSSVVRRAAKLVYGTQASALALQGDLDASCVTDGDRLLQILVNLLQNARDAAPGPVEVRLGQGAPAPGPLGPEGAVSIEIRDRGPGLSKAVRARLFQPFVTTKPPGQGTGLGLYTCARLSEQLGGVLTLEDAPGGGAMARLLLPAVLGPREGEADGAAPSATSSDDRARAGVGPPAARPRGDREEPA